METIKLLVFISVIVFSVVNLIYLLTPPRKTPQVVKQVNVEDKGPYKEKPLLDSLISALHAYNIKHDTRNFAKQVLAENPGEDDLEVLIGHAMRKIREKYR